MPDTTNSLITHLPPGDIQYIRMHDRMWGVAIYEPGTVACIKVIASEMDKGVAAWFAERLREARNA